MLSPRRLLSLAGRKNNRCLSMNLLQLDVVKSLRNVRKIVVFTISLSGVYQHISLAQGTLPELYYSVEKLDIVPLRHSRVFLGIHTMIIYRVPRRMCSSSRSVISWKDCWVLFCKEVILSPCLLGVHACGRFWSKMFPIGMDVCRRLHRTYLDHSRHAYQNWCYPKGMLSCFRCELFFRVVCYR